MQSRQVSWNVHGAEFLKTTPCKIAFPGLIPPRQFFAEK
jgi:hypothetical protein